MATVTAAAAKTCTPSLRDTSRASTICPAVVGHAGFEFVQLLGHAAALVARGLRRLNPVPVDRGVRRSYDQLEPASPPRQLEPAPDEVGDFSGRQSTICPAQLHHRRTQGARRKTENRCNGLAPAPRPAHAPPKVFPAAPGRENGLGAFLGRKKTRGNFTLAQL
jgi:hypothetical protein